MSFQIKVEKLFSKGAVGSYFRPQNCLFAIVWVSGVYGGGAREVQRQKRRLIGFFTLYFPSPLRTLNPLPLP